MTVSDPLLRADFNGGRCRRDEDSGGERITQRECECTEDGASSAVPQVLSPAVLLPFQWLHPVPTQTIINWGSSVNIPSGYPSRNEH